MRKTVLAVFVLVCMAGATLAAQTRGPNIRVGGSSLRANGQLAQGFQYTGPCPVQLKFGWGIVSEMPVEVAYTFDRSDGGHSSRSQRAMLAGGGHSTPLYYDWQLGANTPQFANFKGWVNLIIEGRFPVEHRIPFTIHCQ